MHLVACVVGDLAPRTPAQARRRDGSAPRPLLLLGSRALGALLQLHVLDRNCQVAAEELDRRLVFFVEAVRLLALDAQHADQLAAHQQRDPELAFGFGEARHRNALAAGTAGCLRPLCIGERVEHGAHQPGDADRLARLGDHPKMPSPNRTSAPAPFSG